MSWTNTFLHNYIHTEIDTGAGVINYLACFNRGRREAERREGAVVVVEESDLLVKPGLP